MHLYPDKTYSVSMAVGGGGVTTLVSPPLATRLRLTK